MHGCHECRCLGCGLSGLIFYQSQHWQEQQPVTAARSMRHCMAPADPPQSYTCCSIGMTRLNVYSGLAGLYFLRSKPLAQQELDRLPFPPPGADPAATTTLQLRELPIAIQDRSFYTDGSLAYPRADLGAGNTLPTTPYHPLWVPGESGAACSVRTAAMALHAPLASDSTSTCVALAINQGRLQRACQAPAASRAVCGDT